MYRTDLFKKAGLTMPEQPDLGLRRRVRRTSSPTRPTDIYGICLRGKAGWGENMAFLTAMANSFGARWFDEKWKPQFDSPEWKNTLTFYVDLMKDAGPPGASLERLQRKSGAVQRRQVRDVDRCHGRRFLRHQSEGVEGRRQGRLRAGARIPGSARTPTGCGRGAWPSRPARRRSTAAEKFIAWATSKEYIELVASKEGWANVPPGTRTSLYKNPEYQKVAPFAKIDAGLRSTRPTRRIRRSSRCLTSACSSWRSPSSRASARPSASSSRRRWPAHRPSMGAGRRAERPPSVK